mmetsp:Transcript_29150/g.42575  ORF Transcript_29150/g.42575 Transcript_29150/m.42575 type:complete len:209 (-) Transcript_29150:100-726(-)
MDALCRMLMTLPSDTIDEKSLSNTDTSPPMLAIAPYLTPVKELNVHLSTVTDMDPASDGNKSPTVVLASKTKLFRRLDAEWYTNTPAAALGMPCHTQSSNVALALLLPAAFTDTSRALIKVRPFNSTSLTSPTISICTLPPTIRHELCLDPSLPHWIKVLFDCMTRGVALAFLPTDGKKTAPGHMVKTPPALSACLTAFESSTQSLKQ